MKAYTTKNLNYFTNRETLRSNKITSSHSCSQKNLLQNLHDFLHIEMTEVNKIILDHIHSQEELIEVVSKYFINSGGKRIRPMLTILVSKIFGYQGSSHYYLAAAIEFIHSATLLHDDVVDESVMRRSQLTAHLKWDNKTSILIGDFLFSQSFKLMLKGNSIKALESFSKAFTTIVEGEVKQLINLRSQKIFTEQEYFQIIHAKTAKLFGSACEIAAIISNQHYNICSNMKKFGIKLGLIFQITDDLLDYLGDSHNLGKNVGDDFTEGKITLPVIIAYNNACSKEKEFWDKIFLKQEKDPSDFKYALEILNKHNIKNLLQQKILNLKGEVINIINKLNISLAHRNYLNNLTEYIANRIS